MSEKKLRAPKKIKLYLPLAPKGEREFELALLSSLLALKLSAETGAEVFVNNSKFGIKFQPLRGLCANLGDLWFRISGMPRAFLAEIMRQWPKSSGDSSYPIKVERFSELSANTQFDTVLYAYMGNKELIEEYLALRLELLDFCIEYLRTKLGLPG